MSLADVFHDILESRFRHGQKVCTLHVVNKGVKLCGYKHVGIECNCH